MGGIMEKNTIRIALITFVTIFMAGCENSSQNNGLTYKAGSSVFHLKKECVLNTSLREVTPPVVTLSIKENDQCSGAFDEFFLKNIKNNLNVSFNDESIMEVKIVSPIKTERGINQSVPDQRKANEIANFYK